MNSFKPWRILHLDLNQGIPELSVISGIQGIYVIFWWHHIPLSEMKILNADLPLNASQVTHLAIKSIAPAEPIRSRPLPSGSERLCAMPQANENEQSHHHR